MRTKVAKGDLQVVRTLPLQPDPVLAVLRLSPELLIRVIFTKSESVLE